MALLFAKTWTQEQVAAAKARVKGELDAAHPKGQGEARLRHILGRIRDLEHDERSDAYLERYVLAVSALVHHEREGGLTLPQVAKLQDLAQAILRAQGVKPGTSRLASLHGDLHLIRGQIDRKDGRHWHAAWEQMSALRVSGEAPSGGSGFQRMALAARLLRLGHAMPALAELDAALADGGSGIAPDPGSRPTWWTRGALLRVNAWRLAGDPARAAALGDALFRAPALPEAIARETAWESLCRTATAAADPRGLLRATRRRASHFEASYVLEAVLWAMAGPKTSWLDECPAVRSLTRDKALGLRRQEALLDAVLVLQDAYDPAIPFTLRVNRVGEMLTRASAALTVDKELLIWAAAGRWLHRAKAGTLALLAHGEYRSLSLRLTEGRDPDVLRTL